jgi:sulfotransferase family protein
MVCCPVRRNNPMSIKIIGVGFGRTGTLSVYTALNELGFPCYHMKEVLLNTNKTTRQLKEFFLKTKNTTHLDFWLQVANSPEGTKHDWNKVFKNYSATVDNPGCCVWRELIKFYPDAKVLLTLHPKGPKVWYESTIDTIYVPEIMWEFKVLSFFVPKVRKFVNMSSKLVWNRSHRGTMVDPERAIIRYNEHIQEIKTAVPSDRLLIYSVDQGWESLCKFLNVPIPETDFPNVNDRAEMHKLFFKVNIIAYFLIVVSALLLTGLFYTGCKLLG